VRGRSRRWHGYFHGPLGDNRSSVDTRYRRGRHLHDSGGDFDGGGDFNHWSQRLPSNELDFNTVEQSSSIVCERGDLARSGVYEGPGPADPPKILWKVKWGDTILDLPGDPPTIWGGTAYFASSKYLCAVDIATGEERWKYEADFDVGGSPTIAGGSVYCCDTIGFLYAIDASTGVERWRIRGLDTLCASPVVYNGVLYYGTTDGSLHAVDPQTGTEEWKLEGAGIESDFAISGDLGCFGARPAVFRAVDLGSGREVWKVALNDRYLAQGASPAITGGAVYFVTDDGVVHALDTSAGTEKWRLKIDDQAWTTITPAVWNGVVYVVQNRLLAIDAATGKQKWEFKPAEEGLWSSPVVSAGVVTIGGTHGSVYAVDGVTGKQKWVADAGSEACGEPVPLDGVLYVSCGDGNIYALK
jgi:outer membrane protein assembly factor BamB